MNRTKKPRCARCGEFARMPGSTLCVECKAEAIKHRREQKRLYMVAYNAQKRAEREAISADPQRKQWTTTSITTITTNGNNPPTVHTETKTAPGNGVKLCSCCGKAPRVSGRSYCRECERAKNRKSFRDRYAREKCEEITGKRTGSFAKPCIECGKNPRVPGKALCRSCYNKKKTTQQHSRRARIKALLNTMPDIGRVNADTVKVVEHAPLVVQQNIQNNNPMHDLETVTPKEHTLNVNVTNPIKVDVQHNANHHWWVGYLLAIAMFLMLMGSVVKSWFR